MKILVVRNDKLGDFMLAYPSFALLKRSLPEAEIVAMVPDYTRELAECCPWIDRVLLDPGGRMDLWGAPSLARYLRPEGLNGLIALFSTMRTGLGGALARIPYRLAPASKTAQFFYTDTLKQDRSLSEKPEFQYNVDLVSYFLEQHGVASDPWPGPPYLTFPREETAQLADAFRAERGLGADKKLVFLHPGSGGSAMNLSPKQYGRLVRCLDGDCDFCLVVVAGPGEKKAAARFVERLENVDATLYVSDGGLRRFAQHIAMADVFISGSTGTLHVAGALNRPTAAFYSARQSATALRWQTLNTSDRHLAFSPEGSGGGRSMAGVDIEAAAEAISRKFLRGAPEF